jgi:hypothetical protein
LSSEIPEFQISEGITKRDILSYIKRIFDPIGLLCPTLLPLKLILQISWSARLGWDDRLPSEAVRNFNQWYAEVSSLRKILLTANTAINGIKDEVLYIIHRNI